ncbi:adenylate/guanylate cyclase domain-containing protein [Treponema bryantii]|uniref:adenylate/guanylate cyclase domain-containing protein n=1 Tax=Treponema bryantii TaxID=163 RepID=UPI0003B37CA1|nr:adenylate/guanylate cyclase domain-containing protein [Treponema bryantii]
MSKRIIVLEPSVTIQSIFRELTRQSDLELSFERNGIKFLVALYNLLPDAVLINARNMNPSCIELVRFIKSVARFKSISVGIFATSDFLFHDEFKINCGADLFFTFDQNTIISDLENLLAKKEGELSRPEKNDIVKTGILEKIYSMIDRIDSLPEIARSFLSLLAEVGELPAASIFVKTEDGLESFYICGDNFTEEETSDFLRVCMTDFENLFPNQNMINVIPQKLEATFPLEEFHSEELPLSAYQTFTLKNEFENLYGTVHIVREGAFTTKQIDLFTFAVNEVTRIMESTIRMQGKMKFERNIRKAFSRFVPEQIIDELVDGAETEAKVGIGEKRDVAIMFCDIRSFTNISECNKPETVVAFLNKYFTAMCTIIKKYGGTVDKFMGDAIMALFGAPVSYEDNCRRAVAAAQEMRDAVETIELDDLILPPGMKFNVGIGIHYGDVIVGSIGSADKTDYSVIGDNVNLASRLEGLTKTYGTMILVSQAVKDDINSDEYVYRHLDNVKVKGKEHPVPIYAVDKSLEDFSKKYREYYDKAFALYQKGVWNLAREYYQKALDECENDKAAALMVERCDNFIVRPPENWDGAIAYNTK